MCVYIYIYIYYVYIYIYIYTHVLVFRADLGASAALETASRAWCSMLATAATVDFRNFIVFLLGRDPGTLKSDIVSNKHPQLICSDLRLSN